MRNTCETLRPAVSVLALTIFVFLVLVMGTPSKANYNYWGTYSVNGNNSYGNPVRINGLPAPCSVRITYASGYFTNGGPVPGWGAYAGDCISIRGSSGGLGSPFIACFGYYYDFGQLLSCLTNLPPFEFSLGQGDWIDAWVWDEPGAICDTATKRCGSMSFILEVALFPVADFTYSPDNPMVGGNIIFDASESYDPDGTIVSYEWDFGDGGTASGQIVTHNYAQESLYPITLTVTDDDGYTSSAWNIIFITTPATPPEATFEYYPDKPMVGGNIIFDASASYDPDGTIVSYEWDFGDGHSENLTDPIVSHIFETPDVYTVTLTVTDNDGLTSFTSKELDLTLKNGDLLLCRSYESLIPNVDFWTHIGIYVEQSNQIVEALEGGVVATPLAEWSWVGKNGRNETCVRALRVKTDDSTRDKAVNFALAQRGKSYDFGSLFLNSKQEGGECSLCKKWYCSELVWAAYLNASDRQINLDQDEKGLVSPDDIDKDNDVEMIGEHKEAIPQRVYWNILCGEAYSPVDLEITDPHGFTLTKQHSEILGATYDEVDIDADGETEDLFVIPNPKVGQYLINVIPEPNALPTDTYTLEATVDDQTMVLAQDVQIQNIPSEPYIIKSKLNPADFDNDGYVKLSDFAAFCLHWFEQNCEYPTWCEGADLDYNGRVDFMDLAIFTGNWLWEKIRADIDIDGDVDFADYAIWAPHWAEQNCTEPDWCSGRDFDKSGSVDIFDLAELARNWLAGNKSK